MSPGVVQAVPRYDLVSCFELSFGEASNASSDGVEHSDIDMSGAFEAEPDRRSFAQRTGEYLKVVCKVV